MSLVPCGVLVASTVFYRVQKQGLTSERPGLAVALPLAHLSLLAFSFELCCPALHNDDEV